MQKKLVCSGSWRPSYSYLRRVWPSSRSVGRHPRKRPTPGRPDEPARADPILGPLVRRLQTHGGRSPQPAVGGRRIDGGLRGGEDQRRPLPSHRAAIWRNRPAHHGHHHPARPSARHDAGAGGGGRLRGPTEPGCRRGQAAWRRDVYAQVPGHSPAVATQPVAGEIARPAGLRPAIPRAGSRHESGSAPIAARPSPAASPSRCRSPSPAVAAVPATSNPAASQRPANYGAAAGIRVSRAVARPPRCPRSHRRMSGSPRMRRRPSWPSRSRPAIRSSRRLPRASPNSATRPRSIRPWGWTAIARCRCRRSSNGW